MNIIRHSEIKGELNKKGFLTKTLVMNKHVAVRNIILNPGEIILPHSVEVDVFFYVIKGEGTIIIGKEENHVTEEDIVICPPNTAMSVKANQNQKFSFLNVKTPSL